MYRIEWQKIYGLYMFTILWYHFYPWGSKFVGSLFCPGLWGRNYVHIDTALRPLPFDTRTINITILVDGFIDILTILCLGVE